MSNVLLKETWIHAPVAEVFKCFTEEKAMLTWHGKEVELNPVPGGIYRVVFENGDVVTGKFLEVIENSRVLYEARYGTVDSTVEINFIPERNGTTVKIKQTFPPEQDISSFDHGWDYFLGILAKRYAIKY